MGKLSHLLVCVCGLTWSCASCSEISSLTRQHVPAYDAERIWLQQPFSKLCARCLFEDTTRPNQFQRRGPAACRNVQGSKCVGAQRTCWEPEDQRGMVIRKCFL